MIVFSKYSGNSNYNITHHTNNLEIIDDDIRSNYTIYNLTQFKQRLVHSGFYATHECTILDINFVTTNKDAYATYLQVKRILNTEIIRYKRSLQTTEILK